MTQYFLERVGNIPVVTLQTETLEAGFCRAIELGVESLLLAEPRILLDLGSLHYFDSAGLGVIVGWIEKCRNSGIDIRLCNPSRASCALFELAQVVDLAPIFDCREAALESFVRDHLFIGGQRGMAAGAISV
jgi:anti-anti-sigma factor